MKYHWMSVLHDMLHPPNLNSTYIKWLWPPTTWHYLPSKRYIRSCHGALMLEETIFHKKKPWNIPQSRYCMTCYTHQISIVPISNDYDHQPHDTNFLPNDVKNHFMAPHCWKKLFLIKRKHEISLDVSTSWHVTPTKSQ
jgi:hypothetical protein